MRTLKYLQCFSPTMVALTLLMIVKDEAENALKRGLPTINRSTSFLLTVLEWTTSHHRRYSRALLLTNYWKNMKSPELPLIAPWNNESFADARNQVINVRPRTLLPKFLHTWYLDGCRPYLFSFRMKTTSNSFGPKFWEISWNLMGNVTIRSGDLQSPTYLGLSPVIVMASSPDFEWKGCLA